jgi:hypothetical protein
LTWGEQPVHQEEEMSDQQNRPFLGDIEDSVVGSAQTSRGASDVPVSEWQKASEISCCQLPKGNLHYISAHLGWALFYEILFCMGKADGY